MSTPLQPALSSIANDAPLAEALLRAEVGTARPLLDTYAAALARAGEAPTPEIPYPDGNVQRALGRRQGLITQALADTTPGRWSIWAAGLYLHGQLAPSSLDPLLLTAAALTVLRKESALWPSLEPLLRSPEDDPRDLPIAQKNALWIGLDAHAAMSGQTLRALPLQLQATPTGMGAWGRKYQLSGNISSLTSPNSDANLLCADTSQGVSCFFVPRWREDGERNNLIMLSQHSTLGNPPVAEIQLQTANGYLLGEEGQGMDIFSPAASVLRLGYTLASCALLRQAMVQALATARTPFDRTTQPLLGSALVDMALESEAALTLTMRLAQAFELCDTSGGGSPPAVERAWKYVMAPAAQFWAGRRAMEITAEVLEWIGGQGLLETPLGQRVTQLFLAAPGHGRGEGTGNTLCLEVLRALDQQKPAANILFDSLEHISNNDPRILAQLYALRSMLAQPPADQQAMGRILVQRLVLTAQACLLRRDAPPAVAQAFITTRLAHTGAGRVLGALDTRKIDVNQLLRRALPP